MAPSSPRRSRKRRTSCRTSRAVSAEQSRVMDSDAPYLPQEIITNILKRLPVKSLIRFQCVCKDWKNLFKNPSFIAEHLRYSTQRNPTLLFQSRDYKRNGAYLCLINRDMQVLEYKTSPSSVCSCGIIGSSNGLLCLESKYFSFILWNPATREVLRVPEVSNPDHTGIGCVGFGFSPIVNDYKIVRLSLFSLDNNRVYLAQVYSVSTRSWKEFEDRKLKDILPFALTHGFTFDGAIFWFGVSWQDCQEHYLISFDIATDSFALIPIPRSSPVVADSRLTTYENKLAMLSKTRNECKKISIDLWVMEKCVDTSGDRFIWTKIYTSNPFPDRARIFNPLASWRNEIVAVTKEGKPILLCNLHTNKFKLMAMRKHSIGTVIWNYAESLVSVDGRRHSN